MPSDERGVCVSFVSGVGDEDGDEMKMRRRKRRGRRGGQTPRCWIRWGGLECRGAGSSVWQGIHGLAVGWVG